MRKQYDYFECEAINKVSPSITRKFKINVQCKPININKPIFRTFPLFS